MFSFLIQNSLFLIQIHHFYSHEASLYNFALTSNRKIIGHFSIENHHFSGVILHLSAFSKENPEEIWHFYCKSQYSTESGRISCTRPNHRWRNRCRRNTENRRQTGNPASYSPDSAQIQPNIEAKVVGVMPKIVFSIIFHIFPYFPY